jgi:hypothetical protein
MASTTPPPDLPRGTTPPSFGMGMAPGSAELSVYALALLLAMVVVWIADELTVSSWLDFFKWTTAAYLLSRGIAKASRVFEY